jgi:hypothetical protein
LVEESSNQLASEHLSRRNLEFVKNFGCRDDGAWILHGIQEGVMVFERNLHGIWEGVIEFERNLHGIWDGVIEFERNFMEFGTCDDGAWNLHGIWKEFRMV